MHEVSGLATHLLNDVATHRPVTEYADVVDGRAVVDCLEGPGSVERREVEPHALHLRVLDGVSHYSDAVATLMQLSGNAECGGNVAASVPRDEEEVAHDDSPLCRALSRSDVAIRCMSCSVRARE